MAIRFTFLFIQKESKVYNFLLPVLFSLQPYTSEVIQQADVVEYNHFYDDNGKHVFDQLILWKWDYFVGSNVSHGFKIVKGNESIEPKCILWEEGEEIHKIDSKCPLYETWTQYDPENKNREVFPKELRDVAWPARKFRGKNK